MRNVRLRTDVTAEEQRYHGLNIIVYQKFHQVNLNIEFEYSRFSDKREESIVLFIVNYSNFVSRKLDIESNSKKNFPNNFYLLEKERTMAARKSKRIKYYIQNRIDSR